MSVLRVMPGDKLMVHPVANFCTGGESTVKEIITMYNPHNGQGFPAIVMTDDHIFDGITGLPVTPPWGYYISVNDLKG